MAEKTYFLIVDDEPKVREILIENIGSEFPNVICVEAKDGTEALQKLSLQKFHVLITDLGLPKIDGRAVIQEMQKLPAGRRPEKVIAISGQWAPETLPAKLGKVEFFAKPIDWSLLLRSLRPLVGSGAEKQPEQKHSIDVGFINPFIESTLEVIQTIAGMSATKTKLYLAPLDRPSLGDISSIVSLNSETYRGSFAISLEEKCYLSIINAMLGENFTALNSENHDGAAEICNQIFGGAKLILNEKGHTLQPAIPTIVIGKQHKIKHTLQGPLIVVEFSTGNGNFSIEAITEKRRPGS